MAAGQGHYQEKSPHEVGAKRGPTSGNALDWGPYQMCDVHAEGALKTKREIPKNRRVLLKMEGTDR
jgi:hypothetical protein